jgi:hypothetical protein
MPAAAAAMAPVAATALCKLPIEGDDPIFAAIAAVRAAREANTATYEAYHRLLEEVPDRKDVIRCIDDDGHFFCGSHRGQPLWASTRDGMVDILSKRFLALLHDRGVPFEAAMENSREKTWWEIEIEQAKKDFDERAERREAAKLWREQSGFDRLKAAHDASISALEDAENLLLETEPTTTAGLLAFLDIVVEIGGDWWGIDYEDVSQAVGGAVRKFVTV